MVHRNHAWLLVATAAIAAAGCGTGASSNSGAGSGATSASGTSSAASGHARPAPVITPAEALRVFTTYIDAPVATQVASETGVLRSIDEAGIKLAGAGGASATASAKAGANPTSSPSDLSVFVPYQQSYPAVFVAEKTLHPTTGPSAGKNVQGVWVFRRDAAAGSWAAVVQANGPRSGPLPKLAQDADGYISSVDAADTQQLALDPAVLPTHLASYLQSMTPPMDEFAPGAETTDARAADAQLAKDAAAKNTLAAVQYKADVYPDRFAFKLASGGALEVFALDRTEVFNDPTGKPHQLTVGTDATGVVGVNVLAPGTYSTILYNYARCVVAVDPLKSASDTMITVLGGYGGILSAHGVS